MFSLKLCLTGKDKCNLRVLQA